MNALLIAYSIVSLAVLSAVMAMLLWAAVADGRAASARRVALDEPHSPIASSRSAIRPQGPLLAVSGAADTF